MSDAAAAEVKEEAVSAGAAVKAVVPKKDKAAKVADENTPVVNVNPEFFAHRVAVWDAIKAAQSASAEKGTDRGALTHIYLWILGAPLWNIRICVPPLCGCC